VVAKGGREGGLHAGGVPGQQRAHLAALLTLLLSLAGPAAAQVIEFDPEITQQEFSRFSRVLAQGIYPTPVQPAGASSLLRFDVGLAVSGININTGDSYWQRAIGEEFSYEYGSYVGVPRLVVMKGLGIVTISGTYAKMADSDISMYGGTIDVPIMGGGFVTPTIALRAAYSQVNGVDDYDQKVYGLEAFIGKGFGPVTPYAGWGRMRSESSAAISTWTLEDQSDIDRLTVGARLSLGVPKLVFEATEAEERSYSLKFSVGF
jgi:hypothetical protein